MEDKSKIVTRTVVESKHIEHIKDSDFENSIGLRFKDPINICFYGEDKESQHTLRSFVSAADNVEVPPSSFLLPPSQSKTCIMERIWAVCRVFLNWSDDILGFP